METDRIDWKTGTWRRRPGKKPDAEIVIAGDWAPIRNFSEGLLENPEAVYGDLLPVLREGHLRIVNLECPLVKDGKPVWKSGSVLKGLPEHITGLTTVPFEVVTLGNNHVFDYGTEAFIATRALLSQNGIRFTGAGLSLEEAKTPVQVTVNGVTVGVISFGEGEDLTAAAPDKAGVLGWDIDGIIEAIQALRSRVHVVIVVCHAGVEYIPFPPPYLADALARMADAGADLVIGHHPHVPQGIQIQKGVPICFSLGNFVFFQPTDLFFRKVGYLVKAGVCKEGMESLAILPYGIGQERLFRLKGTALDAFLKKLEALSRPLARREEIAHAWHGFFKHYGKDGFTREITGILAEFEKEPRKGAAMFRNRLTTLQHARHLIELMTRIMEGTLDDAPAWAVAFVEEYFSRRVGDGFFE